MTQRSLPAFPYGAVYFRKSNPPRENAPYPDTLDWLQFRIHNAYQLMCWRVDLIRGIDDGCAVTAHALGSSSGVFRAHPGFDRTGVGCNDNRINIISAWLFPAA